MSTLTVFTHKLPALSAAATAYIKESRADNTMASYESRLRDFASWCDARGAVPVPANATDVANFIAERAVSGMSPGSLRNTLAALVYAHKLAGAPFETDVFAVLMKGVTRKHGGGKKGKDALETGDLVRAVDLLPKSIAGARDRAMLLLGFAAALRRSELVGLFLRSCRRTRKAMSVS